MKLNSKYLYRSLLGLYLVVLLVLCFGHFNSSPNIPKVIFGLPMDKVIHFLMFFPFPILAFLSFDRYTETLRSTLIFTGITFVIGCLMAVGTEWGQAHLTTHRTGDSMDLAADLLALGISSALVIIWDLHKQKK